VRDASERHYVNIGKVFTVLLVLAGGYVASQLGLRFQKAGNRSGIGAGTGAVVICAGLLVGINAWSNQRNRLLPRC